MHDPTTPQTAKPSWHRARLWASLGWVALGLSLGGATCRETKIDKTQNEAHYNLAVDAMQRGDVRVAAKEFETALSFNPEDEKSELGLGILHHISFRKLEESEKHYKKALLLKPRFSEAQVNLGNLYLDSGRYDEAITCYEQALGDLYYQKAYLAVGNEGWAFYKKGQPEKAVGLIQEAIRANPEFCQGYRNLGLIHVEQGQLEQAKNSFEKMATKCPDAPEAQHGLGQVALKQGRAEDAKKAFAKCFSLAKEGAAFREECGKLSGLGGGGP